MNPHEIHHIKAYIVFCVVSIACVGLLAYLYLPMSTGKSLTSSALETEKSQSVQQTLPSPEIKTETAPAENASNSETSGRRMRLTQILIRAQKELQTLEEERKSSPNGLNPVSEHKITKLREKISNIEKIITEIK